MSLVLGYASKDSAIIMSDGRAGENGCYSEYYNKTLKVNDNIILGAAGVMEGIKIFLSQALPQMGKHRPQYKIDDFWYMMESLMRDEETQKYLQSAFLIIGRHSDGNMYTSIIGDSTDYALEKNKVTIPRFCAIGGTIDGSIINEIVTEEMTNKLIH